MLILCLAQFVWGIDNNDLNTKINIFFKLENDTVRGRLSVCDKSHQGHIKWSAYALFLYVLSCKTESATLSAATGVNVIVTSPHRTFYLYKKAALVLYM
jgi:hypothetical protein